MKSSLFILFMFCGFTAFSQVVQSDTIDSAEQVYSMAGLEIQPQFPGEVNAFQKEVSKNFLIPEIDSDLDAKIYINFVIEKDGSVSTVKCIKDPGYGLGQAAVMAVNKITTKWKPGIYKGVPVRVSYSLPIMVKIKGDDKPAKEDSDD